MSPLVATLQETLTCDPTNRTAATLIRWGDFLRRESRSMPVFHCNRKDRGSHICISLLKNICTNSSLVVVKTIRTPMFLVGPLLASLPKLKVIYYTRDPRGIMNSRRAIHKLNDTAMVKEAKNLCMRMNEDYAYYRSFSGTYPDRIMHIKYESLAHAPMEYASVMYKYVDKVLGEDAKAWVRRNTYLNRSSAAYRGRVGTYSTSGRDSRETAEKWRKELRQDLIERITSVCNNSFLQTLGYPLL